MSRGYCGQCGGPYSDDVPCKCQKERDFKQSLDEIRRDLGPLRKDGNLYDELVDLRREEEQQYCPRCGDEVTETDMALCLCPNCGTRVCEGVV